MADAVPSQLCLLSDLPVKSLWDKVRFLGCVASYSTTSAVLVLQDAFPRKENLAAMVDLNLVLPTLKSGQTDVGQWVNVIGYVTACPEQGARPPLDSSESHVYIQAILLWPSGPMDIAKYEACVNSR